MKMMLAVSLIAVMTDVAAAQSTAVILTPRAECTASSVGADVATRPDTRTWTLEILVNGTVTARRDRAPFTTSLRGGPGTYKIDMRWVRSGATTKLLDSTTVICHPPTVTTTPATQQPPPPPPPPTAPAVPTFTAEPSLVASASVSSVRLNFPGVTGATRVTIDHGVGEVTGASFKDVPAPAITTFFTIQARNAAASVSECVAPNCVSKMVTVTVNIPTPPPPPPPPPDQEQCGDGIDNDKDGQIDENPPCAPSPTEICGNGQDDDFDGRIDEDCPTDKRIWGYVDPVELGEWTAEMHDRYIVDGNDTWWYRVYHPQCIVEKGVRLCAGHEHGDDPATQRHPWVLANFDGRMGYAARRDTTHPGQPNGHEEPHNGYKIHVVNIGDVNNEGRVNRNATTSMPHMGTGGPARMSVSRHSVSIADWHEDGIHHSAVHAMFETGTKANPVVDNTISSNCPPRAAAPTKDGLVLGQCAQQDSSYEIWSMVLDVMRNGVRIFRKFVTPAVFDPITVFNPANPGEAVYYWDPRVKPFMKFQNDWSGFRGCAREGYSQVGYHNNAGDPSEEYLLDVRTQQVMAVPSAFTTRLVIGRSGTNGGPGTPFSSDIVQFKMRRDHCQDRNKLGLKN